MAAPTEIYVDPSIAGDSGAGTIGDPYGDLEYGIEQTTFDTTNGTRTNIKTGTDEVLAASIDVAMADTVTTAAWVPTDGAPAIFQGYTSAAGDGGIGGISGNGSIAVIAAPAVDDILFVDMHLHNTGSAVVATVDDRCAFIKCEIDNSTGSAITCGTNVVVASCYIHNIGTYGVNAGANSRTLGCTFENETNNFADVLRCNGNLAALFNIFDVDSSTRCVVQTNANAVDLVMFNSFFASAGTGKAIFWSGGKEGSLALNNIIEGFSGAGGVGIDVDAMDLVLHGANTFYNNTTNESIAEDILVDLGLDLTPGASPFTDAANDDFTIGTSVKALAYPTSNYPGVSVRSHNDMGALQREEPAGGGGTSGRQSLHSIESGGV